MKCVLDKVANWGEILRQAEEERSMIREYIELSAPGLPESMKEVLIDHDYEPADIHRMRDELIESDKVLNFKYIALRYHGLQFDRRNELPAGHPDIEVFSEELCENYGDMIKAYLFSHVKPKQLPNWLEKAILKMDFNDEEWNEIIGFIMDRAKTKKNLSTAIDRA